MITLPREVKARVLALASSPEFAGCNDGHLTDLLAERESIQISRSTVRRWLRKAEHPSPRKRRPPKHWQWRARAPREGQLLLIDASEHASYFYQRKIASMPDKYEQLRYRTIELFEENSSRYGYRRIHALLARAATRVSEKIVRRIMLAPIW